MGNSVVWIPHQIDLNYSKAEKYGTLRFITDRGISGHPASPRDTAIRKLMTEIIEHEYRQDDYVLYSGSPYTNIQFMMMLAHSEMVKLHGVRLLRWSSMNEDYQVMKLTANGEYDG